MKTLRKTILLFVALLSTQLLFAQGPGGGQGRPGGQPGQGQRGPRMNPAEMAKMEKTMIMDSIPNLSADQMMLIDQIFADMSESTQTLFENARNGGDRTGMREKMQAIRASKNEALKQVFTEEQQQRYAELLKRGQERRREGRQARPQRRKKKDSSEDNSQG
ncbi:MAG: hypothetical protein JXQ96_15320 [Cyclobacteriaceae bacterium]